jgi:hypothetical protein
VPAPPELVSLQRYLVDAFRREDPLAGDPDAAQATRAHVAGNDRLAPAEQADIYREQFWIRHKGALAEDYPGLAAILGQEAFDAFLTAYLKACPPVHPSLRDLGDRIVPFAEGYTGFPAEAHAAALEMVRYEHALVEIFDGEEPPPLDAEKLAGLPEDAWDRARVVLHPLLHRMRLAYPVHTHRIAVSSAAEEAPCPEHEGAMCDPEAHAPSAIPEPRAVCLALFRRDLVVSYEELDPPAFALLEALAEGVPLPRACERVAAALDETEAAALGEKVGAWFQQWTAWRWITDVRVEPEPSATAAE